MIMMMMMMRTRRTTIEDGNDGDNGDVDGCVYGDMDGEAGFKGVGLAVFTVVGITLLVVKLQPEVTLNLMSLYKESFTILF